MSTVRRWFPERPYAWGSIDLPQWGLAAELSVELCWGVAFFTHLRVGPLRISARWNVYVAGETFIAKPEPAVTEADVKRAAARYAQEASAIAADVYARAFQKQTGRLVPPEFVVVWSSLYQGAMIDAYETGALERMKMEEGDFTPEPWTDQ